MASEELTAPRFLNLAGLPDGFRLRDLVLEERIGKGGFGVVYRARRGERLFAVKLPLLELTSSDEKERSAARAQLPRIDREISSLKSLKHPNVITVTEFFPWDPQSNEIGGDDGLPIIVMPFINGPTLDDWVQRDKPSLRTVLRTLRDIASALGEVHKRNFVHRDIKPANILMAPEGRPVLIDFGIAKGRSTYTMTGKQQLVGTLDFFAPEYVTYTMTREFLAGKPFPYGPAQDIYALGHTYYLVLTGVSAWAGYKDVLPSQDVSIEFLEVLKSGIIPAPSEINPAVPKAVDALVLKMLERSPTDRFASGQELVDAVEALTHAFPIPTATFDDPFSLPPEEERLKRVRDSSERILAEDLPVEALAPAGSVEVSLSGLSGGLSKTYVRSQTANVSSPPVPTANHRVKSLPGTSAARSTVPLGPAAAARQASKAAAAPGPKAGTAEFRPPSAVKSVGAFETPAEHQPDSAPPSAQFEMNPELERLRDDLAAARPAGNKRPRLVIGGLIVVIVALGAALMATSGGSATSPAPTSLIDASEKPNSGAMAAAAELPPPLPVIEPAPVELKTETGEAPIQPDAVGPKVKKGGKANPDAKAVDDILKREYGGQRPVLGEGGAPAPAAAEPSMPAFAMRAAPSAKQAPSGPRRFGITMGSEIPVKLIRPLDSRTPPCIVVAKLSRPFAPRGDILLPTGTLIYGTATAGNGRFEAQLTRLKLPDGEESPFLAIAYDASDKKPGLAPSRRVTASSGSQGPGIGEQVMKSTANAALSNVAGNDGADVARSAGQTVLNGNGPASSASAQEALMLDAPADFTVFITEAF